MRQGSDTRDFCIKKIVAPLVVLFITFLVYYPTLIYGFVFDDLPTIINYIHARTLDIRSTFFSNSRWVSRLLNQYTYVNWGENPFAYRIFDVLLHIVNGLMVFALLLFLLSKFKKNEFIQRNTYPISLLTMILFLLHPVQTQTVTYITQIRLEGLVAFFIFATLLTFVYSVYNTKSIARYLLLMLSFILAAFGSGTKEIIVGLPFVVAVVDWFFISQGEWSEFKNRIWIHLTLASIVWGFLFLYGNITPRNVINIITNPVCNNRGNILTPSSKEPITIYYYMISQFKVILHYFLIFFFPFGLSFDYGYVLSRSFYGIDVLLPLAVLISLGFVIFRRWLSDATDIIVFCFLWFLILMLPRTSIFISTELVCDYKTYAASFGMMLLLAYLIIYAVSSAIVYSNTLLDHRFEVAGSILFVCALCYATVIRNNVWSSDLLFWKDAMEKSDKARCYHNYATALYEKGDINGAIQYFTKAIEKDDFYGEPHVNLALIYQNRGNYVTAMEHYKRALEIGEGHPQLFNNLGLLHFTTNSIDKAECCFKQAIVLCPYDSRALYNLGNLYRFKKRFNEAKQCYLKALQGNYKGREILYSLGVVHFDLNEFDDALKILNQFDVNYQNVAFYLGGCFFSSKNYSRAAQCFEIAYNKNSKDKILTYNYALALLNIFKYDKALPLFEQLKSVDVLPYAALHYARCLIEVGNKKTAKAEIDSLIKMSKNADVRKEALGLKKLC